MPYIDKRYAEELLRKSQSQANANHLKVECDTPRKAEGRNARCDSVSHIAPKASQKPPSHAFARFKDAPFVLEPIMDARSEDEERAFEKVKRLACARERGSRELVERLMRDGFPRDVAESSVQRALDCGLVDDVRYGTVLVRTRVSQGRGRKGIEDELDRAGIVAGDIPGWPEEFFAPESFDPFRLDGDTQDGLMCGGYGCGSSDESEVERALALLRRKPPRSKNVRASAYRKLVAKGYSSSVASAATRRFMQEN